MSFSVIFAALIIIVMLITPFVALNYWLSAKRLARRADYIGSLTFTTLQIDVPRNNEKTPLSAEQFFSSLHGILRDDPVVQEHVSFEIVASQSSIQFYIFLPVHLQDYVEGQLYAQYPDVNITRVEDYARTTDIEGMVVAQTTLAMTKEDVYPIRTFVNFEVDPLAGITAVLSKLLAKEKVWIQVIVRPVSDSWQKKGLSHIKTVRSGGPKKSDGILSLIGRVIGVVFKEILQPGSSTSSSASASSTPVELPGPVTEALSGIENKVTKLGYEAEIRVVSISDTELNAKTRIQSVVGAFKQFNTTNMNGFTSKEITVNNVHQWADYINRAFEEKGIIFNTEELASIYHFPNQSVETPNLSWAGAKKGEAPANLPMKEDIEDSDITLIGRTDFRNSEREFGIKMLDRMQHTYIIGKSGGGKSKLMLNMIKDDIVEGRGVIVVDPHGELAEETMSIIPPGRLDDTIIFDPSDREFPIAFNLLEAVDNDFKGMVTSGFVGIFKKIFGFSWGPRLEHILRNTVLALLDYPDSTMLSIPRMLTEKAFREQVIDYIKDPVITDFWINEFGAMDNKFASEAVSPILNKVGQFLSTPTIRNIVGQKRSAIDIRRVMDQQKILIVNLSRGKIGEDNAALMGAMMITKVQLAAMSRADTSAANRPPVFLYVDEFQNFATESFAVILSEARKYGLGLTLAHQYINQMPEEVRDAVFGNVGTIISFRVGATDSEYLVKEFAPVFDAIDLVNLEKYHIYIKLLIDGLATPAFSAATLAPPEMTKEYFEKLVTITRENYASKRSDVEASIEQWSGIKEKMEARQAARETGNVLRSAIGGPTAAAPIGAAARPVITPPPPTPPPSAPTLSPSPSSPSPSNPTQSPSVDGGRGVGFSLPPQPPIKSEPVGESPIQRADHLGSEKSVLVGQTVTPPPMAGQGSGQEKEEYKTKLLKVIGDRAYKEHTQRGGQKWYVGEPLDLAIGREQDRYRRATQPKQEEPV